MDKSPTSFDGSIPEKYDRYLGPMLFDPYAKDIVSRLNKESINDQVLELACGTGRVSKVLRSSIPSYAKLFCTDLNQDMLHFAKINHPKEDIHWQVADAQNIPFPENSFDAVVCQFGFMFMPDKAKAFSEAFRVLKKGGKFYFNTWDKLANNGCFYLANEVVSSFFPDNPPIFYQIPFSLFKEEEIHALTHNAGFSGIKIELIKKELSSPSAKNASIGIVEGNPIYTFINAHNPALLEPIRSSVEKELEKKFGSHTLKAPMQAWVIEAIKA